MNSGLRISISEQDFKSKPIADQNWLLFQAITKIDQHGCDWAARTYKQSMWQKLTVLGAAFGAGLGFAFMIGRVLKLC